MSYHWVVNEIMIQFRVNNCVEIFIEIIKIVRKISQDCCETMQIVI